MKRILSLIVTAVLLLGLIPALRADAAISAGTYETRVEAFLSDPRWANGTPWGGSHTQTPGISGWPSSGCCAYCADFAGFVYGSERAWNSSDFTKFTNPAEIRTGDIVHFRYSNSKRTSEHWIVVLERRGNTLYTAEGNAYVSGKYSVVCVTDSKWAIVNGTLKNLNNKTETCYDFSCYHYNFSDSPEEEEIVQSAPAADLGTEFYAVIRNAASGKPITLNSDGFIRMGSGGDKDSQLWKFTRQKDGSYAIRSQWNGDLLEMYGANTKPQNPVAAVSGSLTGDHQRWFLYQQGSGYILRCACAPTENLALDMFQNNSADGTPIITWPRHDGPSQIWTIDKKEICKHSFGGWKTVTAAACTEEGLERRSCTKCGESEERSVSARGHSWDDGVILLEPGQSSPGIKTYGCGDCGATKTESFTLQTDTDVCRIAGTNRFDTAFRVADAMKETLGLEKFDTILVASGVNFADALAGSYLASVKNAPILLSYSSDSINAQVAEYIQNNLSDEGTVYILGGESAVPAALEARLSGFAVKRLAGQDRFATNLAILEEAGVGEKDVLICTGLSFADSLSASAAGLPILLVWQGLTPEQEAFLSGVSGDLYVIGGTGAVSDSLVAELSGYGTVRRLGGGNRFQTSVMIAQTFFEGVEDAVLAYAWDFPDGLCGGPLACTMGAPLILTMTGYEDAAAAYIGEQGVANGTVLGGKGLISDGAIREIYHIDPSAEIPLT